MERKLEKKLTKRLRGTKKVGIGKLLSKQRDGRYFLVPERLISFHFHSYFTA